MQCCGCKRNKADRTQALQWVTMVTRGYEVHGVDRKQSYGCKGARQGADRTQPLPSASITCASSPSAHDPQTTLSPL